MPCKREHVLNVQSIISLQDMKLSLLIHMYIHITEHIFRHVPKGIFIIHDHITIKGRR